LFFYKKRDDFLDGDFGSDGGGGSIKALSFFSYRDFLSSIKLVSPSELVNNMNNEIKPLIRNSSNNII